METITLTIADGGQGQVHEAKSINRSLHVAGMRAEEQRDIYIHEIAEAGIELVENYLGLTVADIARGDESVAVLKDLQTTSLRNLASYLLDRANRIDGRGL